VHRLELRTARQCRARSRERQVEEPQGPKALQPGASAAERLRPAAHRALLAVLTAELPDEVLQKAELAREMALAAARPQAALARPEWRREQQALQPDEPALTPEQRALPRQEPPVSRQQALPEQEWSWERQAQCQLARELGFRVPGALRRAEQPRPEQGRGRRAGVERPLRRPLWRLCPPALLPQRRLRPRLACENELLLFPPPRYR
jgi:hypothetical protein